MTFPLMALAFFSVIAGYVSLPTALGGSDWFGRYLEPVFGASEALLKASAMRPHTEHLGELGVMGVSVAVAGAGILLACWFYWKSTGWPTYLAERFSGLYRVLVNKYYVDGIYRWLVVQPVTRGSETILWRAADSGAIDGLMVNGSAGLARGTGGILRRIQSGNLRSYAAWILLGAVLWLGYVLLQ